MTVTRETRNKIMAALYIICIGLFLVATDDLYMPKPEREMVFTDDHGIPHTITMPAIEGGLTLADMGFLIVFLGIMLTVCTIVDTELQRMQPEKE